MTYIKYFMSIVNPVNSYNELIEEIIQISNLFNL